MIGQDNFIIWIVVGVFAAICLVILGLLARVTLRRKALSHQPASKAATSPLHDLAWNIAPVFVFALAIAPLIPILRAQNTIPAADVTITVTGRMWYWTYQYLNYNNLIFSAPMLSRPANERVSDLTFAGAYDHILVPVDKTVRIVAVGANVIYSWAIPSIGAKIEAVPGWSNQSWFRAPQEGRYYGECAELCGLPHAFRPFEIEVVSQARFDRWVADSRGKLAPVGAQQPQGAEVESEVRKAR